MGPTVTRRRRSEVGPGPGAAGLSSGFDDTFLYFPAMEKRGLLNDGNHSDMRGLSTYLPCLRRGAALSLRSGIWPGGQSVRMGRGFSNRRPRHLHFRKL